MAAVVQFGYEESVCPISEILFPVDTNAAFACCLIIVFGRHNWSSGNGTSLPAIFYSYFRTRHKIYFHEE
jgi:hypothetical protein